jgi:hypothetical protein
VAEGDVRLSGVVVDYDPAAKRATRCELLTVKKLGHGLAAPLGEA